VEPALQDTGVERLDATQVEGRGEYHDFFACRSMTEEEWRETATRAEKVVAVIETIAAHTGLPGGGIVAVEPVEKLFLVCARAAATPVESQPATAS
jgi:nitrogen regulatory protein PII